MTFFARSFVALALCCAALVLAVSHGPTETPSRPEQASSLWLPFDDPGPPVTLPPTTEPPTTTTTLQLAPAPSPAPRPQGVSSGDCANPVISEATARRESGCNWNAYNPSGCGGLGCTGFYQISGGHYLAVSPWNPNVSGVCYGLDKWDPAQQTECAQRLGPGAWG